MRVEPLLCAPQTHTPPPPPHPLNPSPPPLTPSPTSTLISSRGEKAVSLALPYAASPVPRSSTYRSPHSAAGPPSPSAPSSGSPPALHLYRYSPSRMERAASCEGGGEVWEVGVRG